jgi:phage terminase large subunit
MERILMGILLPHHFSARPYQKITMDAFFNKRYKRFIDIEHRRAGKDKKWLNIICAASQERVGTYIHTFPKLSQAKKAIWKGMDYEGFKFIDHFPKEMVSKINNSDMSIEFTNGSIYQLLGADNYNTYMGANPVGIIFSEYALQDPDAWRYFEPMVLENDGWVAFIYTPRGKNHGYQLYETNKNNPKYFTQLLSIKDTEKAPGVPIYTEEGIEEIRKAGTPEEVIQQEYYCSFTSAIMGAYYSKEMKRLEEENHIRPLPIEPHLPVHTFWDLGFNDSTFIWFMQAINDECRFIHCYEAQNEGIPHYVNYLHQYREKKGIVYGHHYAPHDIAVSELGTGKSRAEAAYQLGLRFETPSPRPRNSQELLEHIHVCRMTLPKCWFDPIECKRGLRCLNEYSKEWDDKNKVFKNSPKHDWTSHGADAFRTFAMAWDHRSHDRPMQIMHNRVNTGPI